MAKRLYVGGLPYSATEQELTELFSSAGTVEAVSLVTDRHTGEAKGFGFVDMSTEEESSTAIRTLNGTEMGGRQLIVNEAKPREEQNRGGGGYSGGNRNGGSRR